jgi:HIRAN domain-containing protein
VLQGAVTLGAMIGPMILIGVFRPKWAVGLVFVQLVVGTTFVGASFVILWTVATANPYRKEQSATAQGKELGRTKVVGVTKKNSDGQDRQDIVAGLDEGDWLSLVREPENPRDPNAIAVRTTNGDQVGYLSRDKAKELAKLADKNGDLKAVILDITGGGKGQSLGVNIAISR